jgi:hypothetical protein
VRHSEQKIAIVGVALGFVHNKSDGIGFMAAIKGRKQRTRAASTVFLQVRVYPEQRAKAEAAAEALGISLAAYVDRLLAREEVDAAGRPVWWTDPAPTDQGELPIGA